MSSPAVVLITGASSGLGMAIACRLSKTHRLLLGGRNLGRLEHARRACSRPEEHLLWPMDLDCVDDIDRSLRECLLTNAVEVHGFVHAAGVIKLLPMRMMGLPETTSTMNVNFLAAAEIVRLLLKRNVNQHRLRSVVFISSTASAYGAKGFNVYSASKGALDALMRSLAVELGPAVRVNSVLPGAIRTPMTEKMFADPLIRDNLSKHYPLGIGEPSDVAAAVAFLMSDEARWITGQQLIVDGGRTVNISA